MHTKADDWTPTRHTLIARLKDLEDEKSWKEFFELYAKLIYGVARKSGLPHDEAEEVVQETVLSVTRKIEAFKPGRVLDTFKAWLAQLIRWRIADQVRKLPRDAVARFHAPQPQPAGLAQSTATVDRLPDPAGGQFQSLWDTEWAKTVVETSLSRLKQRVRPKHYQIFEMHVLAEQPPEAVAAAFGVTVAQVHLVKHRVSAALRKEISAVEKANGLT